MTHSGGGHAPWQPMSELALRRAQLSKSLLELPRWRTFDDCPLAASAQALPPELPDLGGIDAPRPAAVLAGCLRLGDPLKLPLAAQVRLGLGEHARHLEEAPAGWARGVDRLLGGTHRGALACRRADACKAKRDDLKG